MDKAITTASLLAVADTSIGVAVVAIIAGFDPFMEVPVATTGFFARAETAVAIAFVAIVASLHAFIEDTIATTGFPASSQTAIAIVVIPVVTFLTHLLKPVATTRRYAVCASIVGIVIAVIAAFAGSDKAIATACVLAAFNAVVTVVKVPIITGFESGLPVGKIVPSITIAAASARAVIETGIGLDGVAIITGLGTIDDPITANCHNAPVRTGRPGFARLIRRHTPHQDQGQDKRKQAHHDDSRATARELGPRSCEGARGVAT